MDAVFTLKNLPLKKLYSGKVRELFEINESSMLMVTTDRISAFDFILSTPVPGKGKILNRLSLFWFDYLRDICPNHVLVSDFAGFPDSLKSYRQELEERSIVVKRTKKISLECVVRGYLSGSGWKEYMEKGSVCGIKLPAGLKESQKLPEPVFTPATKEEIGRHDENISFEEACSRVGSETANFLKEKSIKLYAAAAAHAEGRGIIIADTKFEFGYSDKRIILIDEALTPDSSRFWESGKYGTGRSQDSLDKQYVRNYLESIKWEKKPPVPELPAEVVEKTLEKYRQIYDILTA